MLRFFRALRQKLLSENRLGKYTLYALGEILLVVVGILIAFQLDAWREEAGEKRLEQKALRNLQLDFQYNRGQLHEVIQNNKKNLEVCMEILSHTGRRNDNSFQMDASLGYVTNSPPYFPQNGFLLDLINSGNLGLFKSDLLRNRLSLWLPTLETLKGREALCVEFDNGMIRFIFKHGSWLNSDQYDPNETIRRLDFPESGFDVDNNELLNSPEFENRIENQVVFFAMLLEEQEKCLKLNDEILALLEGEIE